MCKQRNFGVLLIFKVLMVSIITVIGVNSHIIDVTYFVDTMLHNVNSSFTQLPFDSDYGDVTECFYSTDIPSVVFLERKFEKVMKTLDTFYFSNSEIRGCPQIILEFRPVKNSNRLNIESNSTGDFRPSLDTLKKISSVVHNMGRLYCDMFDCNLQRHNNFRQITEWAKAQYNISFPFGVKYNLHHIDETRNFNMFRISGKDVLILDFNLSPESFLLSNGMFKKYFEILYSKNSRFIHKFYPYTQVFYQFTFKKYGKDYNVNLGPSQSQDYIEQHQLLLNQYLLSWLRQENTAQVIQDPFLFSEKSTGWKSFNTTKRIIPYLHLNFGKSDPVFQTVDTVSAVFNTLQVSLDDWKCLDICGKQTNFSQIEAKSQQCSCASNAARMIQNNMEANVALGFVETDQQTKYIEGPIMNKIKLKSWTYLKYMSEDSNVTNVLAKLALTTSIACVVDINNMELPFNKSYVPINSHRLKVCEELIKKNISTDLIFEGNVFLDKLELDGFDHKYVNHFFLMLKQIKDNGLELMKENRNMGNVLLQIAVHRGGVNLQNFFRSGLYCDRKTLELNELYEAILNWGEVNQVNVILSHHDKRPTFFWTRVEPPPNLIQSAETFSASIRNFPKSMSDSLKIDPCLEQTRDITSEIVFSPDQIGVTFGSEFGNSSLSSKELELMMRLVLNTFSTVDLNLGKSAKSVKSITTAVKNIIHTGFERSHKNGSNIVIGIPFPSDEIIEEIPELVEILEETSLVTLKGIYFHGDQTSSRQIVVKRLQQKCKKYSNLKLGMSLANCTSELNHFIVNSSVNFPSEVNFLVCQTPNIEATNGAFHNVENLLDGHLVIVKAFEYFLPNVHLHFQLNMVPPIRVRNPTKSFLFFLSDLNQFSRLYQVSYFFPAFDSTFDGTSGWWNIKNTVDLSNSSNYIEKLAEHLHKQTWIPKDYKPEDSNKWFIIGMCILGSCLLLAVLVASVCGCRMRKKLNILTSAEVQEFLEGRKASDQEEENQNHTLAALKFNEAYSIKKDELNLDVHKILGKGNFGTVFQAKVGDKLVAVKSPNIGCSHDSFKSMLTEVKLMCHIGEHENVVTFVGAYVKEISKGVIYIATELCENGSLLLYLRAKNTRENGINGEIEMEEMGILDLLQFSKEIASGMAYIARKNVVHGDLSARNVLLDTNNTCKIADFGLARKLYEYSAYVKKSHEPLPWRWMAYESLKTMEFTTKSDVWGYGVTLWEIFSLGDVPYPGVNWSLKFVEDIKNGMRMVKPEKSTYEIFSLMQETWNLKPEMRPNFDKIHGFFHGLINSEYTEF